MAGRYKEPQFFALDEGTVEFKLDWYLGLFNEAQKLETRYLIEASTSYFMSERVPRLIRRHVVDPRIVIVLRDPVEHAFARHQHLGRGTS